LAYAGVVIGMVPKYSPVLKPAALALTERLLAVVVAVIQEAVGVPAVMMGLVPEAVLSLPTI
jgi:hypothetical protein